MATESTPALVGAWVLVSYVTTDISGDAVIHPLGPDARGVLLYSANGYMSVQIAATGRRQFELDELHGGSVAERARAASGYLAYAGPFSMDSDGIVTHLPDVSLFPNWESRPIPRQAILHGDELVLSLVDPITIDGQSRTGALRWRRVMSAGGDQSASPG